MLKSVLKYTILFGLIAYGANYYQNQILPNQSYNQPTTQDTKRTTKTVEPKTNNQNDTKNQQVTIPAISQDSHADNANALSIPQHTPVPLEGYRWPSKDITISMNSNDPAVQKAFHDAINAWNKTGAVNLNIVNNDENPDIVCGTQDLSANTKTNNNVITKELGLTQCQYDPTRNQIHHATSNIDENALKDATNDYRAKVAMHELGHALGLDHAQQGQDSVMVPYNVGSTITQQDIDSVKALYGE